MRLHQGQLFVHFQVHFDKQAAFELVRGEVMNGQTFALRGRADSVEQMFTGLRPRLHVHHHVGGNDLRDTAFDGVADGVNLFETRGSRHADGHVHKMMGAAAAHPHPLGGKHTV